MPDKDPRIEYVPQPPSPYKQEKVLAEVSICNGRLQVYINRREVDEHTAGRVLIKVGAILTQKHLPKLDHVVLHKPDRQ